MDNQPHTQHLKGGDGTQGDGDIHHGRHARDDTHQELHTTGGTGEGNEKKEEDAEMYTEVKSIRGGGRTITRWVRRKQGGKVRTRKEGTLGNQGREKPDNGSITTGPPRHEEEAKGIAGGYKRPVSTKNDVARGDEQGGSNKIGTGRHTEAEDGSKTRTKTQSGGQPTSPQSHSSSPMSPRLLQALQGWRYVQGKDLTRAPTKDLEEKDNGTATHNKDPTEGRAMDTDEEDDDTKTLTGRPAEANDSNKNTTERRRA